MKQPSKLATIFSNPLHQAGLIAGMILVFTLLDYVLPHKEDIFEVNSGPWIVATAMILCFIILNTLVALRINSIIPYWTRSVLYFLALLAFSYAWCYFLSGKHIDEAGSFRWLWFVMTFVYIIFFVIARSVKQIADIADNQEKEN